MATEDDTGFDLYECQVCFEYMLDRQPRLLQCHHSFCSDCLQQLVRDQTIQCPLCKSPTQLLNGKVESLSVNFTLLKMGEREQKILSKQIPMCMVCQKFTSVSKCRECNQAMCKSCVEKHNKMKHFQEHVILKLCKQHGEGVTHVCLQCVQYACVTCMVADHAEHDRQVVVYDEGMQTLRTNTKQLQTLVQRQMQDIKRCEEADERKMAAADSLKRGVVETRDFHNSVAQNAQKLLDDIENKHDRYRENVRERYREAAQACSRAAMSLEGLSNDADDIFIRKYTPTMQQSEGRLEESKIANRDRYQAPPYILAEPGSNKVVLRVKNEGGDLWLRKPELVQHIVTGGNIEITSPRHITAMGQRCILVADHELKQVTKLDISGKLLAKFYPLDTKAPVRGAALYGNDMYIAQPNGITKMPLSHHTDEKTVYLKPQIKNIWKFNVVNQSQILISDDDGGNIFDFNPQNNTTKRVVKGIKWPTFISVAQSEDGPLYIVTLNGEHCIDLYNSQWQVQCTIGGEGTLDGQLQSPRATAVTSAGNVMVADWLNHRISLFTLGGAFIKHVITSDNGLQYPCGLAYQPPYLWVSEFDFSDHAAIKCFRVAT